MPSLDADGIRIAYDVHAETGAPILLIHGFGSTATVNWIATGWVETLVDAGYAPITFDNRGHGDSAKLYDPELYHARDMAEDARLLLDHLGIGTCPVLGYSMGARIAAFLALNHPHRVSASIWGGMGMNLVEGLGNSDEIIGALLTDSVDEIASPTGRQFRLFAERTGADRRALAACMVHSRDPMPAADVHKITAPVLIAIGEADTLAGPAQPLAELLPDAEILVIARRDHLKATGDPAFKAAALDFLDRHAVQAK